MSRTCPAKKPNIKKIKTLIKKAQNRKLSLPKGTHKRVKSGKSKLA